MLWPQVQSGEGPILETATQLAQDTFFNVLEVTQVQDRQTRQHLRALLEAAHMEVGFGAQPGLLRNKLNLADLDEAGRRRAVAEVQGAIDQAYELGCRLLAFMDGPQSYPGEDKAAAATDQLETSIVDLCRYASGEGREYELALSLETFDRMIEKKSLIGPTAEAVALARRVRERCTNFGLTLDLSHLPLIGESSEEALTQAKDYIIHAHAGNCVMRVRSHPAYGDQHPRFGAPGGENDVDELVGYLRALFKIGYFEKPLPTKRPVLTFEVKPMPGESAETIIANTKRVLTEAWAHV
jgi:sugar phosphate isomerase/epimerase